MLIRSSMKPTTRRRLLDAMLLVGAILFATVALWAYAQERHDLPPFDYEKARNLTPEKRAEYERSLFNEILHWNTGSPNYPGRDGTNRREEDWLAMAGSGYELAYLSLQVLQPSTGIHYAVDGPLTRVSTLVQGGETGAMCLYFWLAAFGSGGQQSISLEHKTRAIRYMRLGAERKHPACLMLVGYRQMTGEDGFDLNPAAAYEGFVLAATNGYGGAGPLSLYFERRGTGDKRNIERAHCWQQDFLKYSDFATKDDVLRRVRIIAAQQLRPDLLVFADQIEQKTYTLQNCIDMGFGGS